MEILNRFGVNGYLLIAYLVNFFIILFVLNKFVFKKAIANIEQRKKLTEDLVKNSESAQVALENAQKEFNEIVEKANNQAMEIIGKADENAKRLGDEIKNKSQEQANEILKKAQERIETEHTTLKSELEKEIGILVADAVEKVVGDLPEEQKKKIMTNIDNKFTNNV